MLPDKVASLDDKRIRRLSTRVNRYVDVAVAIQGDRPRALSYLFRWTSYDRASSGDWQGKLSAKLHRMATTVADNTDLPRYFDEASAANVCLADDGGRSFRATAWLSETFHKDDFARVQAADIEGGWLFDKSEEGPLPKSGAPLFVPKTALDVSRRSWMVRRADGAGGELSCPFTCTLYIAIVPIAASLHEPCRAECWLLLRPEVSMQSGRVPVWAVSTDGVTTHIKAGDDIFHPVDEAAFQAWSVGEEGRLFVARQDEISRLQSDLLTGCWWCVPATPSAVARHLSTPRASGQPLKGEYAAALTAVLDFPNKESGETDFHAVAPDLYPPPNTLALEITYGLSVLQQRLQAATDELRGAFGIFQHAVRSASPLLE
jgi:hypothetical protein